MNPITKKTRSQKEKQNFVLPIFFLSLMALIAVFSLSSFQDTIQADVQDTVALVPETLPDDTTALEALGVVDEETDVDETVPDIAFVRGEYTTRQKRIGERLFNGLVGFSSGLHNCASCHYTEPQKEMNWNPAAWELAKLWEKTDNYNIMQVMNTPMGARMMEDHDGMTINEQEKHLLEAYYVSLLEKGPSDMKAYPIRAAIFWGLGVLMLLALVDLIITRKIKFRAIHVLILLVGLAVHGQFAMTEAIALGRTEGYAPDQPIKFSHLIHAGENEIDCRYCHYIADYSPSGGIPSNNVCMNCHNVVRNGTYSGRFEINKIHQAAESGEPVEWIRIHKLPDHSFFSHAQHVNAGKLDCSECHGQVETMHILQQVEDLSMGWCLTCHRENHVDFMDNPYYHIYEKLHQKILSGEIDGVTAAEVGGEDCMKCHY